MWKIEQFKDFSVPYSGRNSLGLESRNWIARSMQQAFIHLLHWVPDLNYENKTAKSDKYNKCSKCTNTSEILKFRSSSMERNGSAPDMFGAQST